ncbi:hypothetical protein B566_EDAN009928 [Ephemera danica]|nr:hypothetical protein B566_EDAN009928 [Ephemera danica]
MVSPALNPQACWEFEGEILVLHHPTTISSRYQAMVHCGSIRQTASILAMSAECLRTGDKALVHFRFIKHPEYLKPGQRMVFREGRTKAVGNVLRLIPHASPGAQLPRPKPNKMQKQMGVTSVQNSSSSNTASTINASSSSSQLMETNTGSQYDVDRRENTPQRTGRKTRGRRGGRGRSSADRMSPSPGFKPFGEQNSSGNRPGKT